MMLLSTPCSREVAVDSEVDVGDTKTERGSGAVSVIPTGLAVDDEDVDSKADVRGRGKEEREDSSPN